MSSETSHAQDAHAHHGPSYVKIWAILLGLLVVSVTGPFIGILWVTLATAFGIAIVKAYLVARYFMHINIEKKFVAYLLGLMLAIVGLFVGGVSPDVMKHDGANWKNSAADAAVQKGLHEAPSEHGEHGAEHGAPHAGAEHP